MKYSIEKIALVALLLIVFFTEMGFAAQENALSWPVVSNDAKPWTRWWWFASDVDEKNLSLLLEQYADAGLGGVEVTPIYGVRGREKSAIEFLSPEWMAMFAHAKKESKRLGLGVDMDTGTGWPFGGPQVSGDKAAKRVVLRKAAVSGGQSAEDASVEGGVVVGAVAVSQTGERLLLRPGEVWKWRAPKGDWTLYIATEKGTGQKVKRAAPGGEGLVADHYSADAVARYLERFSLAFRSSKTESPRAFFSDSYEVYGANWTDEFLKEFLLRRGYDLSARLPELSGDGDPDIVARLKSDYRETLSDLLLENFARTWVKWSHGMGSMARYQAHGSPGNLLDLYAAADIPETESFGSSGFDIPGLVNDAGPFKRADAPDPLVYRFAASAAHLTGRGRVSAEAMTWNGEHFRVSLSRMKPEIDRLFTSGINHIVFQGTAYSPADAKWPGWLFYAAVEFNPQNTWWRDFSGLTSYVTRMQSFLQAGSPDGDALLYWPVYDQWFSGDGLEKQFSVHNAGDWLHKSSFGEAAKFMENGGYQFDYVSDRLLSGVSVSKEGRLVAGNGAWRALVVPRCRFMPPDTLERILSLARNGATVIFLDEIPKDAPGLNDVEAKRAKLLELASQAGVGRGKVLVGNSIGRLFASAGITPEELAGHGAQFIRMKYRNGSIYFISNFGKAPMDGMVRLSAPSKSAVIYDPLTGQSGVARVRSAGPLGTDIKLQLSPGGSLLVRTFTGDEVSGKAWDYHGEAGPGYPVDAKWKVKFISDGPELPPDVELDKLLSWTRFGGAASKYFAGTALYTTEFVSPGLTSPDWLLDLGRVAESAQVRLNGYDVGKLWSVPFSARVGKIIRPPGEMNRLEIEVTNLMANRIIPLDKRMVRWKIFYDVNFVDINYQSFDASKWQPMESGLIGPVQLIPLGVSRDGLPR
jgi:hypothetical protein